MLFCWAMDSRVLLTLPLKPAPGCLQAGLWGLLHSTGQLNMHMEDWTNMSFVTFSGPDMLNLRDVAFIRRSPR